MSPLRAYYPWGGNWRGKSGSSITPDSPPPPPARPGSHRPASTIFGSSAGVPSTANTPTELDQYRNRTKWSLFDFLQTEFAGAGGVSHSNANPLMKAFHNYDQSIPTSVTNSAIDGIVERNLIGAMGMKASDVAVANGNHNAAIASFCQSYTGTKTLYVGLNHEPENNTGYDATYAANWRASQAKFAQQVIAARGSRPIVPFVCVINWNLHNNNKTFNYEWNNPAPEMLALGVNLDEVLYTTDGYDVSPTQLGGAENLYTSTSARARAWGFKRFGVSEGACKSYSTSDRAITDDWIQEMRDLCVALDFEYYLWFNSGVGNRAGPEGWWIYGDTNKAAWARVCAGV